MSLYLVYTLNIKAMALSLLLKNTTIRGLIVLFVFVFLIVSGVVLAIVLGSINASKNKKAKGFVLSNSERIKSLVELNKEFEFFDYKDRYREYKHFDNKGSWRRTEPTAFLLKIFRDDYLEWVGLKRRIERNQELNDEYKKRVSVIKSNLSKQYCEENGVDFQRCLKYENKIFEEKTLKPKTGITFCVALRYSSPKGQVQEEKTQTYNFTDFVRLLDSVSQKRVDRGTYELLAAGERAVLTDSMRYDVLKRDGFKCVLCGMTSKDGAILHVDHIIPIAKGGRTEMSNLRTLCERCNLGKSDKLE